MVEDGQPFVEEQLKGILPSAYQVKGRLSGDLPRTGELNPDNVRLWGCLLHKFMLQLNKSFPGRLLYVMGVDTETSMML